MKQNALFLSFLVERIYKIVRLYSIMNPQNLGNSTFLKNGSQVGMPFALYICIAIQKGSYQIYEGGLIT